MKVPSRRLRLALVAAIAALAVAIPVLAASPKPSNAPDKVSKPEKGPETAVTVTGAVVKGTDEDGRPAFTITAAGKTWALSAGPAWFWGDKHPLAAYVGKSVTVVGTTREGSDELDVETIDGTAIRAPGKPPWAGGPRVVGEKHPGWKDWTADGKPGKGHGNGHGRDEAPGQQGQPDEDEPTPTP